MVSCWKLFSSLLFHCLFRCVYLLLSGVVSIVFISGLIFPFCFLCYVLFLFILGLCLTHQWFVSLCVQWLVVNSSVAWSWLYTRHQKVLRTQVLICFCTWLALPYTLVCMDPGTQVHYCYWSGVGIWMTPINLLLWSMDTSPLLLSNHCYVGCWSWSLFWSLMYLPLLCYRSAILLLLICQCFFVVNAYCFTVNANDYFNSYFFSAINDYFYSVNVYCFCVDA